MSKRLRIITATALGVLGLAVVIGGFTPGTTTLNAAGINETGIDLAKYFVWGGVAALVASALLFISASAE